MKTIIKLAVVFVLSIMFCTTSVFAATVKATYVVVESTVNDDIYGSTKMNTFIIVGDTYKISTNANSAYSDGYLLTPSLKTVDLTSGAQTPTSDQAVTYPPGTNPEEINKAISDYLNENGITNPTDLPK